MKFAGKVAWHKKASSSLWRAVELIGWLPASPRSINWGLRWQGRLVVNHQQAFSMEGGITISHIANDPRVKVFIFRLFSPSRSSPCSLVFLVKLPSS